MAIVNKEPWQMTKTEWSKERSHEELAKIRIQRGPAAVAIRLGRLDYGIPDKWVPDKLKSGKLSESHGHFDTDKHPLIIQKALSESKPVPPEVLADYPDLKPKQSESAKFALGSAANPDNVKYWTEMATIATDDILEAQVKGSKMVLSDKSYGKTYKQAHTKILGIVQTELKRRQATSPTDPDADFLRERLMSDSVSAYSTTHFTDSQNKLLKSWVRKGIVAKVEQPIYSGAGNRYRYYLTTPENPNKLETPEWAVRLSTLSDSELRKIYDKEPDMQVNSFEAILRDVREKDGGLRDFYADKRSLTFLGDDWLQSASSSKRKSIKRGEIEFRPTDEPTVYEIYLAGVKSGHISDQGEGWRMGTSVQSKGESATKIHNWQISPTDEAFKAQGLQGASGIQDFDEAFRLIDYWLDEHKSKSTVKETTMTPKPRWIPIEPKGKPEGDNYYGYPNKKELEGSLTEIKTHIGERVMLSGGGGSGEDLVVLKGAHIEEFPMTIKGKDVMRWGIRAVLEPLPGEKIMGRKGVFDPWLDSWQIAVSDKPAKEGKRDRVAEWKSEWLASEKKAGTQSHSYEWELPRLKHDLEMYRTDSRTKNDPFYQELADDLETYMNWLTKRGESQGVISKSDLLTAHEARPLRSQSQDNAQLNSAVLSPDDPKTKSWLKDFGDYDVQGIDTPSGGKGRTAKTKRKKSGKRKSASGTGSAGGAGGMKGIR